MMKKIALWLALLFIPTIAYAQTVGTYTEQNGAGRNTTGVQIVSGTVAVDATATGSDSRSNTGINAQNVDSFNSVYDGTTWRLMRGDQNGTVVQPGLSSTYWQYNSGATGILSNTTTGVTMKAAGGASVRNYIDACQLVTTAFGAAVPVVIRDGTGGTVIWATQVSTAGFLQPVTWTFPTALRSTANTLLEIATPTANTTGTVTISCQGHTGI